MRGLESGKLRISISLQGEIMCIVKNEQVLQIRRQKSETCFPRALPAVFEAASSNIISVVWSSRQSLQKFPSSIRPIEGYKAEVK